MKKIPAWCLAIAILPLFGVGCVASKTVPQEPQAVVPTGWKMLTDSSHGIRALVPESITYHGCSQPVTMGVVDGVFSLGSLWTPCLQIAGVPTDNVSKEVFDDSFSGYTFEVEENIHSAEDARLAVEKRWNGDCTLKVRSWSAQKWDFVAGKAPPNAWTPSACPLLDNKPAVKSLYVPKTAAFIYWVPEPGSFPLADGSFADDQVRILPNN